MKRLALLVALGLALGPTIVQNQPYQGNVPKQEIKVSQEELKPVQDQAQNEEEAEIESVEEKILETHYKIHEKDSFSVELKLDKMLDLTFTDKNVIQIPITDYITFWCYNEHNTTEKRAEYKGCHLTLAQILFLDVDGDDYYDEFIRIVHFHDYNRNGVIDNFSITIDQFEALGFLDWTPENINSTYPACHLRINMYVKDFKERFIGWWRNKQKE